MAPLSSLSIKRDREQEEEGKSFVVVYKSTIIFINIYKYINKRFERLSECIQQQEEQRAMKQRGEEGEK